MLNFTKRLFIKFGSLGNQKGVSIYLALIIMAILLAIALGLNTLLIGQIKIVRGMGYSVAAFYAAETGVETALYNPTCTSTCVTLGYLDLNNNSIQDEEDSTYNILGINPGVGGCVASNYCIKSVGTFKEVKRAIQISM